MNTRETYAREGETDVAEYIDVIALAELTDGEMREVEVEDHAFLVVRVDGEAYVTDARCPHLHAHLAKGTLEGTVITCPWHGSRFDVRDGSVLLWTEFEGVVKTVAQMARHPRPLRVYETSVEGGMIRVGEQKDPAG